MNKKTIYEQPTAELFVVRFEENILSGWDDPATNNIVWGDDDTDNGME